MITIRPCIIHQWDPLGEKIGGIEVFIKNFVKYAPDDFEIDLVGVTSNPRIRPIGKWQDIKLEGKKIRFFPSLHVKDENARTKIPLSLIFTSTLFKYKKQFSLDGRILEFHRTEPLLAFSNYKSPKFLFLHANMMHLYLLHNESKWEKFPWLYFQLERRLIGQAEKIFAVGEEIAQNYSSAYPMLFERISFVPNGINEDIFYPYSPKIKEEKKNNMLQEFGLSPKDNLLLFAGRLDGQKDPLLLIDVFNCLRKSVNNVKLIIAGTGRLEHKMKQQVEEYSLAGEVKFVGTQSQTGVAELMRTSDVFLLTSATEGMPMVALESQACGLPVVSTDVGEVKRIIKEGSSGEVVLQRNPEMIAQKILKVLINRDSYSISNCCERTNLYRASDMLRTIYDAHYS